MRNPLEPYAFDTEDKPFIIQGRATSRQQHVGVHTATYDRALVYAVQRAMLDGTLAVMLHLDVTGLDPLPDRDAMIEAERPPTWLLDIDGVAEAIEAGDEDLLGELLEEQDYTQDGEFLPNTWTGATIQKIEESQQGWVITNTLQEGGDLLGWMTELLERGTLPPEFWAKLVNQQRYMTPFGLDRLVQVDAVRPIRDELRTYDERLETGDDYPEDDETGPQVFCNENFFDEQWEPDIAVLWKRDAPRPEKVEYHGTDVVRALSAFPELAPVLINPWGYGQPVAEVETSIFAVPQEYIEASVDMGVGIYPMAQDTGRLLLGLRSWMVDDPGMWAGFGGAANLGEDLQNAALRELREETGYAGEIVLQELRARAFLGTVPEEFGPRLNWETHEARWVTIDEAQLLEPKHWSLGSFLDILSSRTIL